MLDQSSLISPRHQAKNEWDLSRGHCTGAYVINTNMGSDLTHNRGFFPFLWEWSISQG